MHAHFRTFARYNRWANARLYAAAAALPDGQYRADRGAFFGSLHGTLNHILVGDRVWLARITGGGEAPKRLDEILHDRLDALTAAREQEDARLISVIDGLDDARLAETLRYANMSGKAQETPLAQVLAHLFNHQTHHRGQAHAIISGLGRDAPELDLIYFLREIGRS
ncbi:MAG: DinB family protein [Alphaproteobacteria bacterium]